MNRYMTQLVSQEKHLNMPCHFFGPALNVLRNLELRKTRLISCRDASWLSCERFSFLDLLLSARTAHC